MSANVGNLDRALRAVLGVALLVLAIGGFVPALADGAPQWLAAAAGLILLTTAALRICPAYMLFGIRTCESRARPENVRTGERP